MGESGAPSVSQDRQEFVESPGKRNRASRGAIVGVVLGACLWVVILIAVGLIKL